MKIVRHIAPDMRQAMRSIREQLGEDAVILSSRRIPEGVEITAAVDFDASSLTGHQAQALTAAPLPTQLVAASHAFSSPPTLPPHAHAASQQAPLTPPHAPPGLGQAPAAHAHTASQ